MLRKAFVAKYACTLKSSGTESQSHVSLDASLYSFNGAVAHGLVLATVPFAALLATVPFDSVCAELLHGHHILQGCHQLLQGLVRATVQFAAVLAAVAFAAVLAAVTFDAELAFAAVCASMLLWHHYMRLLLQQIWLACRNAEYRIDQFPFDPSCEGVAGKPIQHYSFAA